MRVPAVAHRCLIPALVLGLHCIATAEPMNSAGQPLATRNSQPESPQGREHRAGMQAMVNGDLAAAKNRFEASLKIDPAYAPAMLGLAAVAQAQARLPDAEMHLQQAEKASPNAAEVKLARGRFQLARGDLAGAEAAFRAAVELGRGQIPPLLELGDLYLRLPGRQAEALTAYRQAVAIDARNPFAQYGLGVAAAASGERDLAFDAFDKAAALRPKDAAPLRAAGRLHLEAGAIDKALAAFDAGLLRQPKFVPLIFDRSDALARGARWDEAIKALLAVEAMTPKSAELSVKLGDAYQGAGRWSAAEKQYLKAIELAPQHPIAYNNLAWMTIERKGNPQKALEWAQRAVQLSPRSAPFHDTLGWAERANGNLPAASASIQRAIELEPRVASFHYHLGVVKSEAKQPAAARAALTKALEIDARMPEAQKVRQLLGSLPAL
jgi:tetratricopeptide (TPR) repeat protein